MKKPISETKILGSYGKDNKHLTLFIRDRAFIKGGPMGMQTLFLDGEEAVKLGNLIKSYLEAQKKSGK